jgi:hypothetical protein
MHFEKLESDWSWQILRHDIYRGGLERKHENLRIVSALAEIRKRHFPNESLDHDWLN